MSNYHPPKNGGDSDPLIKSKKNKRKEGEMPKAKNIPSLKMPKIKRESVGGIYQDPIPKTKRSKGKILIPGGSSDIVPLAAGKGKIDFVKKDLNWKSPKVIFFIVFGGSLYLGGIVVTFLQGMTDVTALLIGIALFVTCVALAVRWLDKAEF